MKTKRRSEGTGSGIVQTLTFVVQTSSFAPNRYTKDTSWYLDKLKRQILLKREKQHTIVQKSELVLLSGIVKTTVCKPRETSRVKKSY